MNAAGKLALVLLSGSAALAQQRTISARAGTIAYQQGIVYVDDQRVHSSYRNIHPFQMKNGQRLRVERGGVDWRWGRVCTCVCLARVRFACRRPFWRIRGYWSRKVRR